jgi:hypothetical protein
MFNNVILDVAIGIIFIFLVYSLLATSIQEAISTLFALRARTLRDGIINGMLCNTSKNSRWESLLKGIWQLFEELGKLIFFKPEVQNKKLGHYLYEHPLIKNYGSSRIFPYPSYLPRANFSAVVIEVLKKDFEKKLPSIVKLHQNENFDALPEQIMQQLANSTDLLKVKELLTYYRSIYQGNHESLLADNLILEKDTWKILEMHLQKSQYNLPDFIRSLENWYDDSMDRISGWYKRRVQVILFLIGMTIAITFNVDIIKITGKLSTDKDAREKILELAIAEAESYKGKSAQPESTDAATTNARLDSTYRKKIEAVKVSIDTSVIKANQILALGWGDFGMHKDSAEVMKGYLRKERERIGRLKKENPKIVILPIQKTPIQILHGLYDEHPFKYKVSYILQESFLSPAKFAGLLLTAIAVCLGAPFWFDLLNKIINIRATGKREENNMSSGSKSGLASPPQHVNVSVGNVQPGEEAVG